MEGCIYFQLRPGIVDPKLRILVVQKIKQKFIVWHKDYVDEGHASFCKDTDQCDNLELTSQHITDRVIKIGFVFKLSPYVLAYYQYCALYVLPHYQCCALYVLPYYQYCALYVLPYCQYCALYVLPYYQCCNVSFI